MTFISLDDTDSSEGGCTTALAYDIISFLEKKGYYCVSHPSLVRLNPAAPNKTRGNGAVVFNISKCHLLTSKCIGWVNKKNYYLGIPDNDTPLSETVRNECIKIVKNGRHSSSNSAIMFSENRPSVEYYTRAVKNIIKPEEINKWVEKSKDDGFVSVWNSGEGIIGCMASLAWPGKRKTYEILAYRELEQIGTIRNIDDSNFYHTYCTDPRMINNFDHRHVCIKPKTPCPVLFGIRTLTSNVLDIPYSMRGESFKGFLVFQSNQCTDDHIIHDPTNLTERESYSIEGRVEKIESIKGRHRRFEIITQQNLRVKVIAFEKTGRLAKTCLHLKSGDLVRVFGQFKKNQINCEKIFVKKVIREKVLKSMPICPECGVEMKARSSRRFFCRKHNMIELLSDKCKWDVLKRNIQRGWIECSVLARRHLYMPGSFYRSSNNSR